MLALLSRLFEAFAQIVEPLLARFLPGRRWVAAAEEEGISFYEIAGERATLRARSGAGDEKALRSFLRSSGGRVELRLRPDQVLQRTLHLPQAGRDFLEPIIEHRLERLVPWRPERVLYGFRAVGVADPGGSMTVELAATSEEIVAGVLKRLDGLDLTLTALGTTAETLLAPPGIDLFRGRRSVARLRSRRVLAIALCAVLGVLVPACIASFWLAHAGAEELRSTETRLQRARGALVSAGAGETQGRDRALIAAKGADSSTLVLIARLSAALPANTFLRELEIDPEKLRLVGSSGDAPALIHLLEKEGLADVRFAAPVTRDENRRDSFALIAKRLPAKPEAGGHEQ